VSFTRLARLSFCWLRLACHIAQTTDRQPAGLNTRSVEAGHLTSRCAARVGRRAKPPPQFGHLLASFDSAQCWQNVHSNEQINASVESGGRSLLQHSQFGRICSMGAPSSVVGQIKPDASAVARSETVHVRCARHGADCGRCRNRSARQCAPPNGRCRSTGAWRDRAGCVADSRAS
jgi:hypothetical protein